VSTYVKRLEEMTKDDFQETGGKAANLGELARHRFNVPPAFCVTARSLDHVTDHNGAAPRIFEIASRFDYDDYEGMEEKTARIRELIGSCSIPHDLEIEIREGIRGLRDATGEEPFVAVRSSVAVRDSAISSFPGMMDTFHFLKGERQIVEHIKKCWASLWTARAAMRRHQLGIEHTKGIIAPLVQKMVNADVAGVMFTANPITGSREEVVIEANWGLGESLVSGESINDYFVLVKGSPPVVKERRIQKKNIMVTLDREKGIGRKKYEVPLELSEAPTLKDEQLGELAALGASIEDVFQFPQDIEWAYEKDTLYVLQSRKIKGLKV
jgi:phosphoenolpyruvate synthase/pyruvate phosphate dikinase